MIFKVPSYSNNSVITYVLDGTLGGQENKCTFCLSYFFSCVLQEDVSLYTPCLLICKNWLLLHFMPGMIGSPANLGNTFLTETLVSTSYCQFNWLFGEKTTCIRKLIKVKIRLQ